MFNQQTRDAPALARALHNTLSTALSSRTPFTHCIFTTNVTFKEAGYKPDLVSVNANAQEVKAFTVQKELSSVWKELDPQSNVSVAGTIEEAITATEQIAKESGEDIMVLITGSLHLVGGALEVLEGL
jgi:folylpolyglutamate synthase